MKMIATAIILASSVFFVACESTSTSNDTLRDSSVRVSGYTQVGGSVSPR